MKHTAIRATLTAALMFVAGSALAAPKSLAVKGQADWISDAPVEKIVGTADGEGALTIDFDDLTSIKGTIKMPVASMKSGNAQRDDHLKGEEWLDAANHPEITFEVTAVKIVEAPTGDAIKEAKVEVAGKFTLRGVTTELTAPATLKWKGDKVKVETAFQVKLADYAVKGKQGVVGNKVGETIDVKVQLKGVAK